MNMKKVTALALTLIMCLCLVSCGEVTKVEKQIDAIGSVTLDSGDAIKAAQDAYNALADDAKAKVSNYATLEEAQKLYDTAVKDKNYSDADAAFRNEDFATARTMFKELGSYKDAASRLAETEKNISYKDAVAAFDAEDYEKAKSMFDALSGFRDSSDRAAEAEKGVFYKNGVKAFSESSYTEAAEAFVNAAGFSDSAQKLFETGKAMLGSGSYNDAANVFNLCEDASAKDYAEYAQGRQSMDKKDFDKAKEHFAAANGIEDSGEMVTVCTFLNAEANMEKGYLNTAKGLYQELPEGYSYEGTNVADRLEKLEKFKSFVELCGVWTAKNMDASVRQKHDSTGLWDQWDGNGWNYDLEITCVLNDDDTATMSAKAKFWHYTNYSTLSKNLKYSDDSCTFKYTGTKVPATMDYSLDFNYKYTGKLTIKGKTFKLDYQIVDKNSSMNFTYTYKSFGTYDTFKKAL